MTWQGLGLSSGVLDSSGPPQPQAPGTCTGTSGTLTTHPLTHTQSLGLSSDGFYSGGPPASGPNAGAWTVWWNIGSTNGTPHPPPEHNTGRPGACTFGPDLSFVGVTFREGAGKPSLCGDWYHQPGAVTPLNLYDAQLARRRALLHAQEAIDVASVDAAAAAVRAAAPAPAPALAAVAVVAGLPGDLTVTEAEAGEVPEEVAEEAEALAALEAAEE